MSANSSVSVRASELADRLLQDIRLRGLAEGDQYLRTDEAGRKFRVRKATVNLAMQLLARRNVLVRTPGHGTFIGSEAVDVATCKLQTVYVVLAPDRLIVPPMAGDALQMLRRELPGVDVHFSFLPVDRPADHVHRLVRKATAADDAVGFILASCPSEVYRFFAENDLPAVVLGEVWRDSQSLPSVDVDSRHAGWLLTDQLLQNGHEKIALLTLCNWRPGDDHFFEGVSQRLAAARLVHDALIVRSLPANPEAFGAEALTLMESSQRPSSLICRTRAQADEITRALAGAGLNVPGDLAVVFGCVYTAAEVGCQLAHVRSSQGYAGHVAGAAEMLGRIRTGENLHGKHVRLPVELVVPTSSGSAATSSVVI